MKPSLPQGPGQGAVCPPSFRERDCPSLPSADSTPNLNFLQNMPYYRFMNTSPPRPPADRNPPISAQTTAITRKVCLITALNDFPHHPRRPHRQYRQNPSRAHLRFTRTDCINCQNPSPKEPHPFLPRPTRPAAITRKVCIITPPTASRTTLAALVVHIVKNPSHPLSSDLCAPIASIAKTRSPTEPRHFLPDQYDPPRSRAKFA